MDKIKEAFKYIFELYTTSCEAYKLPFFLLPTVIMLILNYNKFKNIRKIGEVNDGTEIKLNLTGIGLTIFLIISLILEIFGIL